MRNVIIGVVLVLVMPVWAQASPLMDAYNEFNTAYAAGDIPAADAAGAKALKLAQAAGDEKAIAVLAYNLARIRVTAEPKADALTPAKLAAQLAGKTDGGLPQAKADLLLALAQQTKEPDGDNFAALVNAVEASEAAKLPMDVVTFQSLSKLQNGSYQRKSWDDAQSYGLKLLQAYKDLGFNQPDMLANLHINLGAAYLGSRQKENYWPASRQFDLAQLAMKGFDYKNVPENYLRARAWSGLARSFILTEDVPDDGKDSPDVSHLSNRPVGCHNITWDERKQPKFPLRALDGGYVGAVLLLYDINADGRLANVRIGAEIPQKKFSKSVLVAARKWRAIVPETMPDACRVNRTTLIPFVFK